MVPHGAEQVQQVVVVEPVENSTTVAATGDQVQIAEHAELLGCGVAAESGALGEIVYRELVLAERVEQLQTTGRGEGGHAPSQFLGFTGFERATG